MTDIEKKAREYAGEAILNAEWNDIEYACEAEKAEEDMKRAFLAGAAYAVGNQWRDAEKEKPEDEEYVLIYHHKYGIEPAVWNERFNCWDDAEGDDCMYSAENVIAWLPIPEYKPKGE